MMSAPRYSMRTLLYIMTGVAVLATGYVLIDEVPSRFREVMIVLVLVATSLFVGAFVSEWITGFLGTSVICLFVAWQFIVESANKFSIIRESSQSFFSWEGVSMFVMFVGGLVILREGLRQFRSLLLPTSNDEIPKE